MPEGTVPTICEINAMAEFSAREISTFEFEAVWRAAMGARK
jgi:hypothetical protein